MVNVALKKRLLQMRRQMRAHQKDWQLRKVLQAQNTKKERRKGTQKPRRKSPWKLKMSQSINSNHGELTQTWMKMESSRVL